MNKSGLVFRKSTGKLVGFTDLGTANSDLEKPGTALTNGEPIPITSKTADHILAFMVRLVFFQFHCCYISTDYNSWTLDIFRVKIN